MEPARFLTGFRYGCWFAVVLLCISPIGRAEQALVYTPLPLENVSFTQARNQPLADLLTEQLGRRVQMRLVEDHASAIDTLISGAADFSELGPLPFLLARERTPDLVPIATLREPDGRSDYRCVVVAPVDGVTSLADLAGHEAPVRVALTRRQSTCGPSATFSLLAERGPDRLAMQGVYQGGHDDVALAVLRGQFAIGGMKESVALRFHGLGLRVLAISEPVPGFVLVARPGLLDDQQAQALTEALVGLDETRLRRLQNGRYGFSFFQEQLFEEVDAMRQRAAPFLPRASD